MRERLLYKKEIPKLVRELGEEYNFWAPVNVKGNIEFKQIENPDEIELDFLNSKVPPKEIVFPRMEVLFEYEKEDNDVKIIEKDYSEKKNLVFGIRRRNRGRSDCG